MLQSPQWRTSSAKFAHQPLQLSLPIGQASAHAPFTQTRPWLHELSHEPQWAGSCARMVHVLPQKRPPFVHSVSLFAFVAGGGGSAVEPAAQATTRLAPTTLRIAEKRVAEPEGARRKCSRDMATSTAKRVTIFPVRRARLQYGQILPSRDITFCGRATVFRTA